jgi:hypothetical protein
MEEVVRKTIGKLAVENNNKVWSFLSKEGITSENIAMILESAYTSLHLWSIFGKNINIARGHWLLSRAQVVAGNKELAIVHAFKCDEYTKEAKEEKESFDLFYSCEAFARAYAMNAENEKAKEFLEKSRRIIDSIQD